MKKIDKVILVHGYNGIPKIFEYFRDELTKRGYEVIVPSFPTQTDITKESYSEVFDTHKDDFTDTTAVVAHSVGNILLVKYLCENNLRIGEYISLAGFGKPFEVNGRDDLNSVIKPLTLSTEEKEQIKKLTDYRYAIYSDNDHIVPFQVLKQYVEDISAEDHFVSGIGHMGRKSGLEKLPEVVELIDGAGLEFPDSATETERKRFTVELARITDADLGLTAPVGKTYGRSRFSVRVLLTDEDSKICVVKSFKHGYIQLPGGGIEDGETIEEAARRETREEVGYKITDLNPLGYTLEERYGLVGNDALRAFVFIAKASEDLGAKLTDEEKEEDFAPVWMNVKDAIKELEKEDEMLGKVSEGEKSYNGTFATRRDLILLRYFLGLGK